MNGLMYWQLSEGPWMCVSGDVMNGLLLLQGSTAPGKAAAGGGHPELPESHTFQAITGM